MKTTNASAGKPGKVKLTNSERSLREVVAVLTRIEAKIDRELEGMALCMEGALGGEFGDTPAPAAKYYMDGTLIGGDPTQVQIDRAHGEMPD